MTRVIVYCEGATEEYFIKEVLAPVFFGNNIFITPSSCGGVSKYSIICRDIRTLCKSDPSAYITTMLDYYGFPVNSSPENDSTDSDLYTRVSRIEKDLYDDVGERNFIPYLMVHEFETLLFSNPQAFAECGFSDRDIQRIRAIRSNVTTPEEINNDPSTAPSKRILSIKPGFNKALDGNMVAKEIGIKNMREECPHFNEWINQLSSLN